MGVPVGHADGDYPGLYRCQECEALYETDETMTNDCPECGHHRAGKSVTPEDAGYDPSTWRDDPERAAAE